VTISELGSLGELLGSVGVLVTFIYLVAQIRENTKSNQVAAKQNATTQVSELLMRLVEDPELADIHARGNADLGSLSDEEFMRFNRLVWTALLFLSSQHYQLRIKAIDEDEWQESLYILKNYARAPGMRVWWRNGGREIFSPPFAKCMDAEIKAAEAAGSVRTPAQIAMGPTINRP
jgi:hypothetical protein